MTREDRSAAEVEVKVKVPEGLVDYCNRNGLNVQNFIKTAIRNSAFEMVYKEMIS